MQLRYTQNHNDSLSLVCFFTLNCKQSLRKYYSLDKPIVGGGSVHVITSIQQ